MWHADDGQLNALLDGELPPDEAREVESHVAGCTECARRLDEARAFLAEAGELLGVLVPNPATTTGVPPAAAAPPVPVTSPTRAEETPFIAPRARGPADSDSTRKLADRAAARVPPTAKEVAVSVEGRTEMTPAIRPVPRPNEPAATRRWQTPSLEKMAWAASLILCLGVGYLFNEVQRLKRAPSANSADVAAAPPSAARQESVSVNAPVRQQTGLATRSGAGATRTFRQPAQPAGNALGRIAGPADEHRERDVAAAPPARKPQVSKPPLRTTVDGFASGQSGAGAPAPAPAPARAAELAGADASNRFRDAAPATSDALGRLDQPSQAEPRSLGQTLPAAFRRITIDEAVRRLSGTIRLIDGLQPARVESGPGSLVPGADPARELVRVTYNDRGVRLVLDQQVGDVRTGSFNGLMPGDTLITATEGGTRVRWVDRKFWLSLTGATEADSLRAFLVRVR